MPDNKTKKIAKNTMFLYFRMALLIVIQLYTSRVILDYLGVEDFGIYNLVAGIIVIMSFINSSMALSVNRFIAYSIGLDNKKETRNVFAMSINIHVLLAIVVLIFGETIGLWFINTKLVIPEGRMFAANVVYQASIVTFLMQILRVPYHADIIANEDMNIFAYLSLFEGIAKLLIVFLLPCLPWDSLCVYGLLLMGIAIITFLFYVIFSLKKYEESHYHFYWSKKLFNEMMTYAGYSTFGNFATGLVAQGQSVLLNIFFGPALNAARGLALSVNGAVSGFVLNIFTAVNPQITKSYAQNDKKYFYSLIYNSTVLSFYLLLLIAIPLIYECDFVLSLWLKEVPAYTADFVRLILINSLVYYFDTPSLMAIQATGKVAKIHLTTGTINLMNLVITYIIWKMSAQVPPLIFFIQIFVSFVMLVATMLIQKEIINISIRDYCRKTLLPALLVCTLSLIVPTVIHHFIAIGWLRFWVTCSLSVCVNILIIYFVGLSKEAKIQVKTIFRQKILKRI